MLDDCGILFPNRTLVQHFMFYDLFHFILSSFVHLFDDLKGNFENQLFQYKIRDEEETSMKKRPWNPRKYPL